MSDLYDIEFSSLADSQIDNIVFYLEQNRSKFAADKVKRGIFEAIEELIEMPHKHGLVHGLGKRKKIIYPK